jgi:NAD(P)-dependent dehydrogenase (short-subunit alcohol dehydrogenase family)
MGPTFSLEGKVAIVTGASRGIGEAIARAFVHAGASVVCASRKIDANATRALGDRAFAIAAHTGQEQECQRLVAETISRFGKVDVLVNNAATNPYAGPMLNVENAAWDKTFEVNVKGYFWMAREVARHLIAREAPGSIVSIASIAGLAAAPTQGVYGMTKAAVLSMTKTLAVELASSKVRVNAIAPGWVDTRFASAVLKDDALVRDVLHRTPQARYATPDEISGGAVFLASDASSYMTGQTLIIDGGLTVG